MNSDGRGNEVKKLEGGRSNKIVSPVLEIPSTSTGSETSGSCGDGESENSSASELSSSPDNKAPVELLGEFLLYVRQGNWQEAMKLCKMIIIYEPHNPEANSFLPLIKEKIEVDKELAALSSDDASSIDSGSVTSELSSAEERSTSENEDDDSGDESEESDHKTKHLKNKLQFLHDGGKVWKP